MGCPVFEKTDFSRHHETSCVSRCDLYLQSSIHAGGLLKIAFHLLHLTGQLACPLCLHCRDQQPHKVLLNGLRGGMVLPQAELQGWRAIAPPLAVLALSQILCG